MSCEDNSIRCKCIGWGWILLETSDGIDLEDGFQITSDAILFEANTKMVSDDITVWCRCWWWSNDGRDFSCTI